MRIVGPLILTLALAAVAWVGTQYAGLYAVFGIVIPYLALASFVGGFVFRSVSPPPAASRSRCRGSSRTR